MLKMDHQHYTLFVHALSIFFIFYTKLIIYRIQKKEKACMHSQNLYTYNLLTNNLYKVYWYLHVHMYIQ